MNLMVASLYRKLNYDLARDLVPVTQLASTPFILAVHPGVPASSIKELIALAWSMNPSSRWAALPPSSPDHSVTRTQRHRSSGANPRRRI